MQYTHDINSYSAYLIKTATGKYDIFWCKQMNNGVTDFIVRKVCRCSVDFTTSPPTWGSVTEIDVGTITGFTNPMCAAYGQLGYDFNTQELLLALGEWDLTHTQIITTHAKLLAINRTTNAVRILHNDLLALAKTVVPSADDIRYFFHFNGYGGKILGSIGAYTLGTEESVMGYYNGSSWLALNPTSSYVGTQELIEMLFDSGGTFIGWLSEAHNINCFFVRPDGSYVWQSIPNALFSVQPVHDMLNNKIIWLEHGASAGSIQRVWSADPDATNGSINIVDVSPTGNLTDVENNTLPMNTLYKGYGEIFSDGTNFWLVCRGTKGGSGATPNRVVKCTLGHLNDVTYWAVLADPSNYDKRFAYGVNRAVDPVLKVPLPVPLVITAPSST